MEEQNIKKIILNERTLFEDIWREYPDAFSYLCGATYDFLKDQYMPATIDNGGKGTAKKNTGYQIVGNIYSDNWTYLDGEQFYTRFHFCTMEEIEEITVHYGNTSIFDPRVSLNSGKDLFELRQFAHTDISIMVRLDTGRIVFYPGLFERFGVDASRHIGSIVVPI